MVAIVSIHCALMERCKDKLYNSKHLALKIRVRNNDDQNTLPCWHSGLHRLVQTFAKNCQSKFSCFWVYFTVFAITTKLMNIYDARMLVDKRRNAVSKSSLNFKVRLKNEKNTNLIVWNLSCQILWRFVGPILVSDWRIAVILQWAEAYTVVLAYCRSVGLTINRPRWVRGMSGTGR